MHRQCAALRPASKASVSSFAYQGTNAHCVLGRAGQNTTAVAVPAAPWQNRRFWFQVCIRLSVSAYTSISIDFLVQNRMSEVCSLPQA